MNHNLPTPATPENNLPPILAGTATPPIAKRVEHFYSSVAEIFEAWVTRRQSSHTQRAYREDVMSFTAFMKIRWPEDAIRLLSVTIKDVQAFRDELLARDLAPKTLNRRIASLSSFYKYLAAAASELRLPITVPNPAHSQFIAREASDPKEETRALSATRARQLMNMPNGDSLIEHRDRAILKLYLYSGIRLSTGCRLKVSDFHQDGETATIRLHEKGDKRRTIGLHYAAAQAITEYIEAAGISSGPPVPGATQPAEPETGQPADGSGDDVPADPGLPGAASGGNQRGSAAGRHDHHRVPLHAAQLAGDDGHTPAGCRRGHSQGARPAGPPARDDNADL